MKYLFLIGIFFFIETCYSQQLPIKPARTIAFTTDEGTEMSVDISPDGKTIVFDLLGDIYTLPVTGGTAKQLTRGVALNLRPIWSPDGKKIAYFSDYSGSTQLNVRDVTGKFHLVLGNSNRDLYPYYYMTPVWSPDGRYIYLSSFYTGNVYGLFGSETPLNCGLDDIRRFSDNGRMVYYMDSGRIWKYSFDNSIKTAISPILEKTDNGLLSPNGQWWVYVKDTNSRKCLMVLDLLTNKSSIIVPSLYMQYPSYDLPMWAHFSFSPDSRNIFIGYGGKIHRINVQAGGDTIIPFAAHVRADAGPFNYNTFKISNDSVRARYVRYAAASPDGKHLVFTAFNKIYIQDLPNGRARLLASQSNGQFQPAWSPDGRWITFVSWCDTIGGYVWRVRSTGGQLEQLTQEPGQYQRPAWSPDGKLIGVIKAIHRPFDWNHSAIGQLAIISLNDGHIRIIDSSVEVWNQLNFSRDGKELMYEPYVIQNRDSLQPLLISKNLEHNNIRIIGLGRTDARLSFIQQRSLSPDGRFIVYSMAEDLYLVPVTNFIRPTIIYDSRNKLAAIRFTRGIDPHWENGGKTLSWDYGNRFYRIDPDKIIEAAQQRKICDLQDSDYITVNAEPDLNLSLRVTVPGTQSKGIIALKDVRIVTMKEYQVIEHGTIVIKNGRFAAIGPNEKVAIPAGAKMYDLPGLTIIPGFVDLHLHIHPSTDIIPQQYWKLLINLAYGITTARDPSSNYDSYGYTDLLSAGQMIGPRLYTVGRAVRLDVEDIMRIDGIEEAIRIVQKRAFLGSTYVKQYNLPTRLQRQWLSIASRQAGLNMTNEGAYQLMFQLAMIKDGSTGIEHSPDWGDVYRDVIQFMALSGTYLTPTLQVRSSEDLAKTYSNYLYWTKDAKLRHFTTDSDQLNDILNRKPMDTTNRSRLYPSIIYARIMQQGGHVVLGSHGDNEGIGVHNELWALQGGGLTNLQALREATIEGAKAMGLQQDIGSIEVGKIADLIILNKNPLDDIHNSREIRYVMKAGVLYDGNTLDEIWPENIKCPSWQLTSY